MTGAVSSDEEDVQPDRTGGGGDGVSVHESFGPDGEDDSWDHFTEESRSESGDDDDDAPISPPKKPCPSPPARSPSSSPTKKPKSYTSPSPHHSAGYGAKKSTGKVTGDVKVWSSGDAVQFEYIITKQKKYKDEERRQFFFH